MQTVVPFGSGDHVFDPELLIPHSQEVVITSLEFHVTSTYEDEEDEEGGVFITYHHEIRDYPEVGCLITCDLGHEMVKVEGVPAVLRSPYAQILEEVDCWDLGADKRLWVRMPDSRIVSPVDSIGDFDIVGE